MGTLWQDVKYGARMLAKNPGWTAVVVVTLGLAIGANTAIFSVVNAVLWRPLPYPDPERLVAVQQLGKKLRGTAPSSPPDFLDFRERQNVFEHFATSYTKDVVLTGGEPERVTGACVSAGFFEAMGIRPFQGRTFTRADETFGGESVVVLGYNVWQRRFNGDTGVIGRIASVSDQPHTIVGVMPQGFEYPEEAELWLPMRFEPSELQERASRYLKPTVARLKPGITVEQAHAQMQAIGRQLGVEHPDADANLATRVVPLHEAITVGDRPALLLLAGAVGFVLLIACANVAHLLLARATVRRREIAVRAAMGASRSRLARLVLTESALLGLAGGALGLLVALWGVDTLCTLAPTDLLRRTAVHIDAWVLTFAVGISLLTGILLGLVPAMGFLRLDLNEALKEGARGSVGVLHDRLRAALVLAEVALSLVLLTGAGLMLRTMWRMLTLDPGFDPRKVLVADVSLPRPRYPDDGKRAAFAADMLDRIRALPGVEAASITSNLPLSNTVMTYGFLMEGQTDAPGERSGQKVPSANFRSVSPDYLRVLRVPLLRGRNITERDVAGAPDIVVINEAMARMYWPGQDPIGQKIRIARGRQPAWREIVGIVGNMRHEALYEEPRPEMYVPAAQQPMFVLRLAIRTIVEPAQLAAATRTAVWEIDKDQPVTRIRPMTEVVASSMVETTFYCILLGSFAGVALVLAAVGIYGVLAYVVSQRTHEIGIRASLGAQPRDIRRLVVGHGIRLTAIGIGVGLFAAAGLTKFLSKQLHGVQPTDPLTFAGVAALLMIVALLACWVPAHRASKVDPIVALRYE